MLELKMLKSDILERLVAAKAREQEGNDGGCITTAAISGGCALAYEDVIRMIDTEIRAAQRRQEINELLED